MRCVYGHRWRVESKQRDEWKASKKTESLEIFRKKGCFSRFSRLCGPF